MLRSLKYAIVSSTYRRLRWESSCLRGLEATIGFPIRLAGVTCPTMVVGARRRAQWPPSRWVWLGTARTHPSHTSLAPCNPPRVLLSLCGLEATLGCLQGAQCAMYSTSRSDMAAPRLPPARSAGLGASRVSHLRRSPLGEAHACAALRRLLVVYRVRCAVCT